VKGAMRALRKRLALRGWHERAVFLDMCGGKHRAGSDSPRRGPSDEKLFPLSRNMKGGIPYSGTLLLSLATEKEERVENTQNVTLPTASCQEKKS